MQLAISYICLFETMNGDIWYIFHIFFSLVRNIFNENYIVCNSRVNDNSGEALLNVTHSSASTCTWISCERKSGNKGTSRIEGFQNESE